MSKLEIKKEALKKYINNLAMEHVFIAFSGGIDSSLLLRLLCDSAKEQGTTVYAVTFQTFLHPQGDLEIAKKVAAEMGAVHLVMEVNELDNEAVLKNPVDRCYHCKYYLFSQLKNEAVKYKVNKLVEGTNADDMRVYRPGIKAVKELGVFSPLAACDFTKQEVREFAKELSISVAGRPSTPCMATRLPYNTVITPAVLRQIEAGEDLLKKYHFRNVRLRLHNEVARIEVDAESLKDLLEVRQEITEGLNQLGFRYITLDLKGFRQGSMDEYIEKEDLL